MLPLDIGLRWRLARALFGRAQAFAGCDTPSPTAEAWQSLCEVLVMSPACIDAVEDDCSRYPSVT